jgi:hypothetical protein
LEVGILLKTRFYAVSMIRTSVRSSPFFAPRDFFDPF